LVVAGHLLGGTAGLVIALLFAVAMNGAAYWFIDCSDSHARLICGL
jgi:hypothetical protein